MADNVDDANALADLHLNVALAKREVVASRLFTGSCYWCDALVSAPAVFCDADCRDDFERDSERERQRNERRLKR
jgi:hypothetical protein